MSTIPLDKTRLTFSPMGDFRAVLAAASALWDQGLLELTPDILQGARVVVEETRLADFLEQFALTENKFRDVLIRDIAPMVSQLVISDGEPSVESFLVAFSMTPAQAKSLPQRLREVRAVFPVDQLRSECRAKRGAPTEVLSRADVSIVDLRTLAPAEKPAPVAVIHLHLRSPKSIRVQAYAPEPLLNLVETLTNQGKTRTVSISLTRSELLVLARRCQMIADQLA